MLLFDSFFIRSKSRPDLFWWVEPSGAVATSSTSRSRFRIDIEGQESGTVIIRNDLISFVHVGGSQDTQGIVAVKGDSMQLWIAQHYKYCFYYSDLKKAFLASSDQHSSIFRVEDGYGEEWELVR